MKQLVEMKNDIQKALVKAASDMDRRKLESLIEADKLLDSAAEKIARVQAVLEGDTEVERRQMRRTSHLENDGEDYLEIEVTDGAINQNYLNISKARKRGWIREGDTVEMRLPNGRSFESGITKNMLSERGLTKEFYNAQRIESGDIVRMRRVSPRVFELSSPESSQ